MIHTSTIPADRDMPIHATAALQWQMYAGRTGFEACRDDWRRLAQSLERPRFFHCPEYYEAYLDSLADSDADFHTLVARRDGAAAAILPFVKTRRRVGGVPVRSVEIPSGPHMLLCDLIASKSAAGAGLVRELVAALRRHAGGWDVLYLPQLLEDGAAMQALRAAPPARLLAIDTCACDYLPSSSVDELLERVSKNFRGNLRKARNKLAKLDAVEFVCARAGDDLADALRQFVDVEASGWKGAAGSNSAIRLDARVSAFYAALSRTFARRDAVEINLLRIAGRCVAGQFCLLAGDTAYILKIGYDEEHAQVAPGNMLLERTIQRYAAGGIVRWVNLITDAPWHVSWKPQAMRVTDAYIFNRTAAGLTAFAMAKARRWLRRAYDVYVEPRLTRRTLPQQQPSAPGDPGGQEPND